MNTLIEKARRNKKRLNWLLLCTVGLIELILMALITVVTWKAVFGSNEIDVLYKVIAIDIILLWVGALIGYFTWAIYFYNINLGLTNEDWAEIRQKEQNGEPVEIRKINPHEEETLGLPNGTIRGTLALSLAVGALALLIASLGIENTMALNQLFVDTFDFFKTAFLMMIAFYFGNKSLQYLNYQGGMIKGGNTNSTQNSTLNQNTVTDLKPTLEPAVDPEIAGVRQQLMADQEKGPDDLGGAHTMSADFDKPDSKG